jgi:hypothetical protein
MEGLAKEKLTFGRIRTQRHKGTKKREKNDRGLSKKNFGFAVPCRKARYHAGLVPAKSRLQNAKCDEVRFDEK